MTFICTPENPWVADDAERRIVIHRDAKEVGEQEDGWPGGDIVTYECPHCKHRWQAELPQ